MIDVEFINGATYGQIEIIQTVNNKGAYTVREMRGVMTKARIGIWISTYTRNRRVWLPSVWMGRIWAVFKIQGGKMALAYVLGELSSKL